VVADPVLGGDASAADSPLMENALAKLPKVFIWFCHFSYSTIRAIAIAIQQHNLIFDANTNLLDTR